MDKKIIKEARLINLILAILLILSIIGWVIDEGKDTLRENQLKQIIIEQQGLLDLRLDSINNLWKQINPNISTVNP